MNSFKVVSTSKTSKASRTAVHIVKTYERMKRNAFYRVFSLIFGCITLFIVKMVELATKEKNIAATRREMLYKELTEKGELERLQAEAEEQIRRKNKFFYKKISEHNLQRDAKKIALQALNDEINDRLEHENIDTDKTNRFDGVFVSMLSKIPFLIFSVIVSFPMYVLAGIYALPYLKFVAERLFMLAFVIFGVILLVFSILYISPSDPAINILGEKATPEQIEQFRELYGLDKPYIEQFLGSVKRIATFKLGNSYIGNEVISESIARKFPVTMELAVISMAWSAVLGIVVGVISAIKHNTAFDYTTMLIVLVALSIPHFWLGLLLVLNLSIKLGWLPALYKIGNFKSVIMPTFVLGTGFAAAIARMTRSSMLEVKSADFVMTAKAKGLSERTVVFRHILKNALIPVITMIGMQFGGIVAGSSTNEKVFGISGIGMYVVEKEFVPDTPAIVASVVYISIAISLANLLVDILYTFIDPRIKTRLKNY